MGRRIRNAAVMVSMLAVTAASGGAVADESLSYKGKTITLIINSAASGGTDLASRMIGTFLAKYLPGEPRIVFRNIPGGGGVKANNYFATQVAPDGITFLGGSRTNLSPTKARGPQVKYDPATYEFIGGDANLGTVVIVRRAAVERLTNPKAAPVVYGDIDGTRAGALLGLWAKEAIGWNMRWVVGYQGQSALILAVQSGELDATALAPIARLQPMVDSGTFVAVAQFGVRDDSGRIVPRKAFPDVPLFSDLILPKLDGAARRAFLNLYSDFLVNKWIALPPRTPVAHVAAYRAAYQKVVHDPEYQKFARDDMGPDYTPLSGEQLQAIVQDLSATSDEDLQFVKALTKKYGIQQVE